MTTRLNININSETRDALRSIADQDQVTVTEVIRRAVAVYAFVRHETNDGATLTITKPDDGPDTRLQVI